MFDSVWITHPDVRMSENKIYIFKKNFNLEVEPDTAILNISAETRYKLYINGKRAAFGPCRPSGEERYYDTLDVAEYLQAGENELYCEVLQLADLLDAQSICFVHGVQRSGNMLFALELKCGDVTVCTDDTWQTAESPCVTIIERPQWLNCVAFEEKYKSAEPKWVLARALNRVDCPESTEGRIWGLEFKMYVKERPIPMLYQKEVPFYDIGDGYYIADELTFGFPTFVFYGKGSVKITYAECFGNGGEKKDRLDRTLSFGGLTDEVTVDGEVTFEPFWFRCARIIKIATEGDVRVERLTFTEVGYPLTYPKNCDFGSEADNKLWQISVATLMRCMQETYEDCPYYEQLQYCMDTSVQMLFNYQLTSDDRLARKAINDFRLSQRVDGLMHSRYPAIRYQFIPPFIFYYIFMVHEHYKHFGDETLVRENLRAIDGVLEWYSKYIDNSGLLKHTEYWDFIDWAPTWGENEPILGGDNHMSAVSAMYVYFLRAAAELNEICGRKSTADEYNLRANEVANAIEKNCWCEERGLYSDDINRLYFSQHTQVWCTLAKIATPERVHTIMKNAIELPAKCTFAYAYFWFRALEEAGLYSESEKMMSRLRTLPELNCTTIPETPDAPRSECHAWGAIAIYEFAAVVLGVRTVSVKEKKLRIAPYIAGRDHASGDVYTAFGKVHVEWKISSGIFMLSVAGAEEIEKEIVMPSGEVSYSSDEYVEYVAAL